MQPLREDTATKQIKRQLFILSLLLVGVEPVDGNNNNIKGLTMTRRIVLGELRREWQSREYYNVEYT